MTRKRGWSLIEILIVIVVIIVIAAISSAALAQAQNSSKSAVISSNLKQVGLAVELYRSENGFSFAESGLPSEMGVPDPGYLKFEIIHPLLANWPHKKESDHIWTVELNYSYDDASPEFTAAWLRHTSSTDGNPVIVKDLYFSDATGSSDPYGHYRGVGLRLDSSLMAKNGYGDPFISDWWD